MSLSTSTECRRDTDADVVIVGAGPVGLYLGLRLATAGHRVIVVEKQPSHYPRPRAVTFDDEIARLLSAIGIDADHDPEIERTDDVCPLRNGEREILAELDWRGVTRSLWHRLYWFHQPDLEVRLARMLAASPNAQLIRSWEAVAIQQDDSGVTIHGRVAEAGSPGSTSLRAHYVVGADGANSSVRQQAGLETTDLGFFFDWLICDIVPLKPEAFDPLVFNPPLSQFCDPARPTTMVPSGPGRRRWEFMALPGEDLEILNTEAKAWELLAPWGVDPTTAQLERHVVWRFQARYASGWRDRRVLIAGDASHLMPPFAGQGMCAGIRDGASLAWRLDLVLRGLAGPSLLDSYGTERQGHVAHFTELSMELGKVICVTDPDAAAARDTAMKAALADPTLAPPPAAPLSLGPGVWRTGDPQAGQLSTQGIVSRGGHTGRFDEVVGRGWVLLGRDHDPLEGVTEPLKNAFLSIGGRSAAVGGEPGGVTDVNGTYGAWFDELGVDVILVRPDFYLAAAVSRGSVEAALRDVLDMADVHGLARAAT